MHLYLNVVYKLSQFLPCHRLQTRPWIISSWSKVLDSEVFLLKFSGLNFSNGAFFPQRKLSPLVGRCYACIALSYLQLKYILYLNIRKTMELHVIFKESSLNFWILSAATSVANYLCPMVSDCTLIGFCHGIGDKNYLMPLYLYDNPWQKPNKWVCHDI